MVGTGARAREVTRTLTRGSRQSQHLTAAFHSQQPGKDFFFFSFPVDALFSSRSGRCIANLERPDTRGDIHARASGFGGYVRQSGTQPLAVLLFLFENSPKYYTLDLQTSN